MRNLSNEEAERTILGAVLVCPEALASAAAFLVPSHFYRSAHQIIFKAMIDMADTGQSIDLVTLKDHLIRQSKLDAVGGATYLASLTDGIPRLANVESWAMIVRDRSIVRRVIEAGGTIAQIGTSGKIDGPTALERAFAELMRVADSSITDGFRNPTDDIKGAMAYIDLLATGQNAGHSTGLRDLDVYLGGLKPGDLILIGARPSNGKTTLAVNIGEAVAKVDHPVAMFSLEMTRDLIGARRLCAEADVSTQEVRDKSSQHRAMPRLAAAMTRLATRPFYVDDTFSITVSQIRAKARRLKHEKGTLGLVIVDYLQLIQGDGASESRQQEVSAISRSLKGLAKDLEVPVVALSQLNRSVKNDRPTMDTLRESGSLEQDADVVLLLHREDDNRDSDGVAECIVAKQRNGPTGTIRLSFQKRKNRFADLAEEWEVA